MEFSLAHILSEGLRHAPQSPCLTFGETTLSYATLEGRTNRVAAALCSAGVGKGDRVALIARNAPIFFELLIGVAKAGAILVPVNWRLSTRELLAIIEDAMPALVVADGVFADQIAGHIDCPMIPTGGEFEGWIAAVREQANRVPSRGQETLALLYTSGTTGRPKGVQITHQNLYHSVRMAREVWEFDSTSVNLVAMPLFHVGGIGYGLMAVSQGGHTVLLPQPAPVQVLEAMVRYQVTHAFFVPSVIQMLVDEARARGGDFSSLRRIIYGAAPIPESLLRDALGVFNCGFSHAYGMTETSGTVVTLCPHEHDLRPEGAHRLQSCGRPVPWVELSVRDPGTCRPVPTGTIGEIWIRSAMVTPGYWRNEQETAAVLDADGWLRTGDAAVVDGDGYVYIQDRYKDMIISGGENVFPAEVENVLVAHDGIVEAAVVAAPHARWGETVRAVVVLRDGHVLSAADIITHCRQTLAHYKCPTIVDIVPALPKSAAGKVLRRELRAQSGT